MWQDVILLTPLKLVPNCYPCTYMPSAHGRNQALITPGLRRANFTFYRACSSRGDWTAICYFPIWKWLPKEARAPFAIVMRIWHRDGCSRHTTSIDCNSPLWSIRSCPREFYIPQDATERALYIDRPVSRGRVNQTTVRHLCIVYHEWANRRSGRERQGSMGAS